MLESTWKNIRIAAEAEAESGVTLRHVVDALMAEYPALDLENFGLVFHLVASCLADGSRVVIFNNYDGVQAGDRMYVLGV